MVVIIAMVYKICILTHGTYMYMGMEICFPLNGAYRALYCKKLQPIQITSGHPVEYSLAATCLTARKKLGHCKFLGVLQLIQEYNSCLSQLP